jgi:hypothetical protein
MPRSYGTTNATAYAAAPAVGPAGDTYWNTTSNSLFVSDGTAWTGTWAVSGSTLTPVDATKEIYIPTTTPGHALRWGTATGKGRLIASPTVSASWWTQNQFMNAGGTAWLADDGTKPSWAVCMGNADALVVSRAPVGSPNSGAPVLTLDGNGLLTLDGDPTVALQRSATLRSYSNSSGFEPQWSIRKARLSGAPVVSGDYLGVFCVEPAYQTNTFRRTGLLVFQATENHSATAGGTQAAIWTTPPGTTGQTSTFTFDHAGSFLISGAVGQKSTGTTWANPSDIRLKRNITDYAAGLDAILALRPIRFEHNGLAGTTDGAPGISFVADEVESVMPEMVGTQRAKLQPDDAEDTDLKTLDVSPMLFAFVNAFKELADRVAALEARP